MLDILGYLYYNLDSPKKIENTPPRYAKQNADGRRQYRPTQEGSENMSEKEKVMLEKIAKLPPKLLNRFADKVDGAVMALDVLEATKEQEEQK